MNEISCTCEFGYELQLVIPYAYYLFQNNLLKSTSSVQQTKELYYFSPDHTESNELRQYICPNVPNNNPHKVDFDYSQWSPPPYKLQFKNNLFQFKKQLLIVHNKYNIEWEIGMINFLDCATLDKIFEKLSDIYEIVYIRPTNKIISDHAPMCDLEGEHDLLNKYNITNANDLYELHKSKFNNFNHFQLSLHANCEKFISVQGGNAVLASYFGGTNIIFAKKGGELECGSYERLYPKFSGCKILHTNDYDQLLNFIEKEYHTTIKCGCCSRNIILNSNKFFKSKNGLICVNCIKHRSCKYFVL